MRRSRGRVRRASFRNLARAAGLLAAGLVGGGLAAGPAAAFDLFGLFGSEEAPPAPSADALPYTVTIKGVDDDDVLRALQDTSTLYRLRGEAPPDGEGLVRRAEADQRRLADVLSGYGYYQGTVTIRVDGVVLAGEPSVVPAARAAEASRARALV
ncbi:hypothetical protein, partial [Sphingomonas sp.]|uniref:hypothetical protein n=1 Tax=Sphingomonas sp. TaxID=28214 RepID=UPI00258EE2E5